MNPLEQLVLQAHADFTGAPDAAALENAKAKYLGKTGQITEQMKALGKLDPDERKVLGAVINAAKEQIEAALTARREALADAQMQTRLNAEPGPRGWLRAIALHCSKLAMATRSSGCLPVPPANS